jgi:hypothetical protein
MKQLLILTVLAFASATFAAEPAKTPAKQETNCVTKDKKGNCPSAPKTPKPTPKKAIAPK